nr:cancer-associated gene 1 protein isoform X1 [Zootoca vivipara]
MRSLFLKLSALLASLQMERLRGLKILCDVGAPLATCAFTNEKLSTAPSEEIGASRKQVAASSRGKPWGDLHGSGKLNQHIRGGLLFFCTWEPLTIMSEVVNPVSTSNIYLDLESCSTASEISQNEVQDSMRKSGLDCTLYKEDHHSELMFEDFAYDFEDASEDQLSPLSTLRTCPIMKDSSFITEWKESNEGLLDQGESEQQCRVQGWPEEWYRTEEESDPEDSQEVTTENAMQAEELLVETSDVPIMGESLLDCIVKESPIVSSFLTQATGSLLKTDVCGGNEDLIVQWNGSNVIEKADERNTMETGHHNESTKDFQDFELTVSPNAVDENLDYIRTLVQSNRDLKERLKSNIACFISEDKVDDSILLPENFENVSEGEHNTEPSPLCPEKSSFVAEEGIQGDRGDKALSPTHSTKSCCLSPYGASDKLWNTPEFSPKQLLLQEGDMDFSKVIKDLELDQQKHLPHILGLQYGSIFSEKTKEIEKLLLEEGDTDLNKIIQALEQGQKRQEIQVMDLYHCDVSLAKRFKEQEVDFFMKHNFIIDTIRKLKENTADLIETMSKVTGKKEEAEGCPKCMTGASGNTKDDLQDFGSEKKALVLQLEKLSADYRVLQEKHQAEVEEKAKYMAQCKELVCTLRKKEQEIQELNRVVQKLEREASNTMSILHKLRGESEDAQKRSLSLEAELQKQKDERLAEREGLGCRYNKLLAQIKLLQAEFENEQAEMEKMQQQLCAFRTETSGLQQEMAKNREENRFLQLESARWKEQCRQIREPQTLKEQLHSQMIQVLRYELGLKREELRKKEEIIEWSMHILGRFLLNMKSMHSALSIRDLHSEEDHFNSPYVQKASHLLSKICSLLALAEGLLTCQDTDNQAIAECSTESETVIEVKGKMQRLLFKKKSLEKELRKHKENIAAMRKLIINEKASEDPDTESQATEAVEEESENGGDLPDLLRTKLSEYHKQIDELQADIKVLEANLASKEEVCKKLTGEIVELQKDLGSLTCKVTSYEEIIECADKRLEQANSEISEYKFQTHLKKLFLD